MQLGLMNNPRVDPVSEIDFFASHGFDFVDLTLEFPESHISIIDQKAVLTNIRESGLGVIGHTTYYLPFASPINRIREAAIADVVETLKFFKQAGARLVTVHPDPGVGAIDARTTIGLNAMSFKIISDEARKHDLTIMVENVPGMFSSPEALREIFNQVPELGFHLDVGHAFIGRDRFKHLLTQFRERLMHVHLSDNRMQEDDHMPLGAGNIKWEQVIPNIKATGYDGTFTLEVFSVDRRYVLASRDKFVEVWGKSG